MIKNGEDWFVCSCNTCHSSAQYLFFFQRSKSSGQVKLATGNNEIAGGLLWFALVLVGYSVRGHIYLHKLSFSMTKVV